MFISWVWLVNEPDRSYFLCRGISLNLNNFWFPRPNILTFWVCILVYVKKTFFCLRSWYFLYNNLVFLTPCVATYLKRSFEHFSIQFHKVSSFTHFLREIGFKTFLFIFDWNCGDVEGTVNTPFMVLNCQIIICMPKRLLWLRERS